MKHLSMTGLAIGAMLVATAAYGQAVLRTDFGKQEYAANCRVCHGDAGKGDGSYGELLTVRAADLTTIAKRNGGVFPFAAVVQVIDGRAMPKAHGTREMPIWGQDYTLKAAEYYGGAAYDPAAFVNARILALTEYVYTLQAR